MLIPHENRTSENMYNKFTLSRLQRSLPQVLQMQQSVCWRKPDGVSSELKISVVCNTSNPAGLDQPFFGIGM